MNRHLTKTKASILHFLLLTIIALSFSCKKEEEKQVAQEKPINISYEVKCDYCDITYVNSNNEIKINRSNVGLWTYKITTKANFELKLNVKTLLPSAQTIQAYILKDDEILYGNIGYNSADISYNPKVGTGSFTFGTYTTSGSGTGNGGGNGGGTGGSTSPSSSVCGAKNKTGGYCKRVVIGGGRCWQHS